MCDVIYEITCVSKTIKVESFQLTTLNLVHDSIVVIEIRNYKVCKALRSQSSMWHHNHVTSKSLRICNFRIKKNKIKSLPMKRFCTTIFLIIMTLGTNANERNLQRCWSSRDTNPSLSNPLSRNTRLKFFRCQFRQVTLIVWILILLIFITVNVIIILCHVYRGKTKIRLMWSSFSVTFTEGKQRYG